MAVRSLFTWHGSWAFRMHIATRRRTFVSSNILSRTRIESVTDSMLLLTNVLRRVAICMRKNIREQQHIVSYADRERYWLDQLRAFAAFPCMFILGADHVVTFSRLLNES